MTKKYYIDLAHENLGEAFRRHISKPAVESAINTVYNQICYDLYVAGNKDFQLSRKRFTDQAVTWDSVADVYYTTYPAAIVPDINMDMVVELVKGSDTLFLPSTEETRIVVTDLQSPDLDTNVYTIFKRERIEYLNMESLSDDEIEEGGTPTPRFTTVRMDLAIQFKEFAITDEVFMPAGRDYEVIQLAVDFLKKEPIVDIKNM